MSARTSWSVRADSPFSRGSGAGHGRPSEPPFADLWDARFNRDGRLVRATGSARERMAERFERSLPPVDARELERAVERLSRQIDEAARAGRPGGARAWAEEADEVPPSRPGRDEPPESAALDILNRLEARLDQLSQEAERRAPASRKRKAPARQPAQAEEEGVAHHIRSLEKRLDAVQAEARSSGVESLREEIETLGSRIEMLGRSDQSLSRAMEAIGDQLADLRDRLAGRHAAEPLTAIETRLNLLMERLASLEVAPSALAAMERGYSHLLERIGQIERMSERAGDGGHLADLGDRIDRLRGQVQSLPGAEALAALEDRVLALAEQIDAAARNENGQPLARLEAQLEEIADGLAGLKEAIESRNSEAETQVREVVRRLEGAGRRSAKVDLSAVEARLDELASRIDGLTGLDAGEALAGIEARLAELGRALAKGATAAPFDPEPLARRMEELKARIDALGDAIPTGGELAPTDMAPLLDRMEELKARIDALGDTVPTGGELAPRDMAPLLDRMEELKARIDGLGRSSEGDRGELAQRLRAIEDRLAGLADAPAADLDGLRGQLQDLAGRLDRLQPSGPVDPERLSSLADRFEALMQSLDAGEKLAGAEEKIAKIIATLDDLSDTPALEDIAELRTEIAMLRRDMRAPGGAEGAEALTPLIKEIASRLERLPKAPVTADDLQAQIERIVGMVDAPAPERAALGAIEDSLKRIEESLESGSRAALKSSMAAMAASADSEASDGFTQLVAALSGELAGLKEAARSSERHTRHSLEAVHDTLDAVLKRLAQLEVPAPGRPAPAAPQASGERQQPAAGPPVGEPAAKPSPVPEVAFGPADIRAGPSAAPAAPELSAAAEAKRSEDAGAGHQSLLGRLTSGQILRRATGGRAESFSPAPEEGDDDPDLPLEPGTAEPMASTLEGAPSSDTALFAGGERRKNRTAGRASAIHRRDEQGQYLADDFLSAARRAAQAAAATAAAEAERTQAAEEKGGLSSLFGAIKARRRVALAAALAIAVALTTAQFVTLPIGGRDGDEAEAPPAEGMAAAPARDEGLVVPPPLWPPGEAPDAPPQPDRTVTFGEPQTAPEQLQRRPGEPHEGVPAARAPADEPPTAEPARFPMPPESLGPERLRQAAAGGDPAAQFEVAARYAEGRGVVQDLERAIDWYRYAAEGGLAPAQYRLGSIYEKGTGTARDPELAMDWYRQAAAAGNVKAMHNLAVLYAEGIAGEPDLETAAQWFRQAAERGLRDSQFNIAVLHARGIGVPQDLIEAYKWFAVAAESGDPQAGQRRAAVAESLSEADLEKARAAARAFEPLPVDPAANDALPPDGGWGDPPAGVSMGGPDLVRRAQTLLAAQGFDPGPADGRLGPRTREAIVAFQEDRGLPATGAVDTALILALERQASI